MLYPMENVMGMNEVIPEESLEMQKERKQRLDSGITQNVWPKAVGEDLVKKTNQVKWKRKNLEECYFRSQEIESSKKDSGKNGHCLGK